MTGIDAVIDSLEEKDILTVLAATDASDDWKRDLAAGISATGRTIIYVAIAQPYVAVEQDLTDRGVDTDSIFFIDLATTAGEGEDAVRAENCVFVRPESLTNVSIALSNAVEALPDAENALVLIDGIDALEMYNSAEEVAEFSHFLTGKIRGWGNKGVILSIETGIDEQLRSRLGQFCDGNVTVGD